MATVNFPSRFPKKANAERECYVGLSFIYLCVQLAMNRCKGIDILCA